MKKKVYAFIFFLGTVFSVFAQQKGPIDLILVLDTSSSMSSHYREVNDYITGSFLREFLRIGDTFHLIPFSGSAAVDIARRIEGQGDVETILGRIFLQYPLEQYTDIAGALDYAEKYAASLPPQRSKQIILITDGDLSPGPDSGSRPLDGAGLQNLITEAKNRLSRQGIRLEYVGVPINSRPESGRAPAEAARAAPARQPPAPPEKTEVPPARPAPPAVIQTVPPEAQRVPPSETAGAQAPPSGAPASRAAPPAEQTDRAGQVDSPAPVVQTSPERTPGSGSQEAPPARQESSGGYFSFGRTLPLILGLLVLVLLILGIALLLAGKKLQSAPSRVISRAAAQQPRREQPQQPVQPQQPPPPGDDLLASYAATQRPRSGPYAHRYTSPRPTDEYEGPLMLNLFVEDQNTLIGKRNIHAAKSGTTFTLGGGKSDFLIFLVSIPPHIGELRCEGNNCTFIPLKPQYFPDIGSRQVPNCIGKTIRVISDKNYELHFRMERYEDPLKALNRLLHSVQVPG
jgi:hypothetical protein